MVAPAKTVSSLLLALALCLGPAVRAAEPEPAPPPAAAAEQVAAPPAPPAEDGQAQPAAAGESLVTIDPESEPFDLVLRNRTVLTLRANVGGMPPRMRARQMQERFAEAISDGELAEPTVKSFPPYGVVILVNKIPTVSVAHLDLDPLEHRSYEEVVAEAVKTVSQILAETREERSIGFMLRALGYSLLATVALALATALLVWTRRFFFRFLERQVEGARGVLTRAARLDMHKVAVIARRGTTLAVGVLVVFLAFTWLAYVLKQFPYTRPWGEGVWTYVLETCRSMGLVIVGALPNLFRIALILLVARAVARLATLLFEAAEAGRVQLPGVYPETARPTRRILVAVIYVFALVASYPYLPGSGSDAFKGISVLIGLMISLGGSGVINQAMSGLVLMYTRAHQVGDYVRIGDTEGVVTALDMLATKIRTGKKVEVTIPNSVVLGTSTQNFTRLAGAEGAILHTSVTIGYAAPWRTVHRLLTDAAERTAGLRKSPPPFVRQTALSDFFVEYQVNAYLEKPETRLATLAELHANIQDAFNEAGVAIVSPHYVADPPEPMPPAAG